MITPLKIACNAGPLIALAKLNLLYLLKGLYGRVYFSSSVYQETVIAGLLEGYEDAAQLKLFLDQEKWKPEKKVDYPLPDILRDAALDQGEHDTMLLALELNCSKVLIDEQAGREVARHLGISAHGTLGVLREAYQEKIINRDQLRLNLAELIRRNDIWISKKLIEQFSKDLLR